VWLLRLQQLERNVQMLSHSIEKLRRDLDDSEQTRARLELNISQLRTSNRDLSRKLKVEKDEVGCCEKLTISSMSVEWEYLCMYCCRVNCDVIN